MVPVSDLFEITSHVHPAPNRRATRGYFQNL